MFMYFWVLKSDLYTQKWIYMTLSQLLSNLKIRDEHKVSDNWKRRAGP